MNLVLERRDQAARAVAAIVESTGARPPDAASPVDDGELKLPADAAAIDLSSIESGVVCLFAEQGKSLRVLQHSVGAASAEAWRAPLEASLGKQKCSASG